MGDYREDSLLDRNRVMCISLMCLTRFCFLNGVEAFFLARFHLTTVEDNMICLVSVGEDMRQTFICRGQPDDAHCRATTRRPK